jgi:hypothetical protein
VSKKINRSLSIFALAFAIALCVRAAKCQGAPNAEARAATDVIMRSCGKRDLPLVMMLLDADRKWTSLNNRAAGARSQDEARASRIRADALRNTAMDAETDLSQGCYDAIKAVPLFVRSAP